MNVNDALADMDRPAILAAQAGGDAALKARSAQAPAPSVESWRQTQSKLHRASSPPSRAGWQNVPAMRQFFHGVDFNAETRTNHRRPFTNLADLCLRQTVQKQVATNTQRPGSSPGWCRHAAPSGLTLEAATALSGLPFSIQPRGSFALTNSNLEQLSPKRSPNRPAH